MTDIQQHLMTLADKDYRSFQSKLIPTVDPDTVIGVRVPVLRSFARSLPEEEATAFTAQLPHTCYEENNLHAFLIERIADYDACVAAVERFLPYVDNWATCDSMRPKVFARNKPRILQRAGEWMQSSHPFTVRFGLEMRMLHGLGEVFDPAFLEDAAAVCSSEYYVQMMVAWFFATALTKRYEETLPYLKEHRLDEWIHKKAIQKACESLLIPPERKAYLKTLKG
ncbi:MAG: DNA alkylation repair protein [Ruminococcaceae bacterium]|nr:DNA alkylation repair protein [Oscillospiraceae bacterium]